jgi:DnaJ-domain-containing protein 1
MTMTEILAIALGLFLGYWLVSRFLERKPRGEAPEAPAAPWPEVLGVAPGATVGEIDAAYARLMGEHAGDEARIAGLTRAYREALAARRGAG